MDLKERHTLMRRDSKPVSEYLQTVKAIAGELALIDTLINDDYLVLHILNNVGPEFKERAPVICARDNPISYEDQQDKLIECEIALKREDHTSSSSPLTTNTAQYSATPRFSYRGFCYGNNYQPSSSSVPRKNFFQDFSGPSYSSRGSSSRNNSRRPNPHATGYYGAC